MFRKLEPETGRAVHKSRDPMNLCIQAIFVAGVKGQALDFEGGMGMGSSNQNIDFVDTMTEFPASAYNGGFSIMGWINRDVDETTVRLITHGKFSFSLRLVNSQTLDIQLRDSSDRRLSVQTTAPNLVPIGEWVHIAASWDGGLTSESVKYYVNGQEELTAVHQSTGFTGLNGGDLLPLRIGATFANSVGNMFGFNGQMDHITFWSGVLSLGQVKRDYNITRDPIKAIEDLINVVLNLNIKKGISNSLDAKLDSAIRSLDDLNLNNDNSAINSLNAFVNAVYAQRGNAISIEDADSLITVAEAIIDNLTY